MQVYPGSSLMKTNAQFAAMRKGALDMSLYPSPYAGGEIAELNIGLMPALVSSYEQAVAWKKAPVGRKLTELLDQKGIVLVSWVWQAGGVASRERAPLRAGGRQGPEGPGRVARDGPDDEAGGGGHPVDPFERILRRHADGRVRRGDHLLHQPDLVPAGGGGEGT